MEGLENLHFAHARLLYIIAEMFREDRITDQERLILKKKIFQDNTALFQIYEQNKEVESIGDLILGLEQLVRNGDQENSHQPQLDSPIEGNNRINFSQEE